MIDSYLHGCHWNTKWLCFSPCIEAKKNCNTVALRYLPLSKCMQFSTSSHDHGVYAVGLCSVEPGPRYNLLVP